MPIQYILYQESETGGMQLYIPTYPHLPTTSIIESEHNKRFILIFMYVCTGSINTNNCLCSHLWPVVAAVGPGRGQAGGVVVAGAGPTAARGGGPPAPGAPHAARAHPARRRRARLLGAPPVVPLATPRAHQHLVTNNYAGYTISFFSVHSINMVKLTV